ncbi:glycoside hydrolase family 16 [Fusarium longipes]|uniref:Glycoside hydrolase family 16 n=1 Tax=Fusarium longipes TaxID=694270 RepID=A0A395T2E7_9HYPO|nr:glycoside hydrolase family 16 [Fusarium longipes]
MAYSLTTSFIGESLISGFEWFNGTDLSNGFVQYQDLWGAFKTGLYSVDPYSETVQLRPDSRYKYGLDEGRPSIRLESKESYQYGLFIADFRHMPISQCGTWPAFWAYGDNWPMGGEIDILEGANLAYTNIMSAHTAQGCMLDPADSNLFSGIRRNLDCGVGTDNVGCGFNPPESDTSSYGDGFNAVGGGVYAMEWDSEYISIWHFPRGAIPADIEAKRPDPRKWGVPQSLFGGSKCNVDDYFSDMRLVLNINFCGDYGEGTWASSEVCRALAPTCREYVANNPTAFTEAYFDVSYIDVYTRLGGGVPPVVPSSASEASTETSAVVVPVESATNTPMSENPVFPSTTFPGNNTINTGTTRTNRKEPATQSEEPTTTTTLTGISSVLVTIPGSGTDTPTVSPLPVATGGKTINPSKIGDYSYIGCFGSQNGFQTFDLAVDSDDMTIERCIEACNGLTYIGLFEGDCYCASALDGDTRAVRNETSCDRPCPGDDGQFCGGMVTQNTRARLRRSIPLRRDTPSNVLLTVYADISDAGQPEVPPAMGPGTNGTSSDNSGGQGGSGTNESEDPATSDGDASPGGTEAGSTTNGDGTQEGPAADGQDNPTASNDNNSQGGSATEGSDIPTVSNDESDASVAGSASPEVPIAQESSDEQDGSDDQEATTSNGDNVLSNPSIVEESSDQDVAPVVVIGTASDGLVLEATQALADANREPVTSTITYFTIVPSKPGSLVPQENIVTMSYEHCDYCETPTLIKPPMETKVVECDGCGPNGEDTVTLTVPISVTITVPGASTRQTQQTGNAAAEAVTSYGGSLDQPSHNSTISPVVPNGMGSGAEEGESSEVTTVVITYLTTQLVTYGTSTDSVSTVTRTARRTVVVTVSKSDQEMSILPVPSPGYPNTPVTLPTPTPGAPSEPIAVSAASSRRDDVFVYFAIVAMAILALTL